MSCCKGSLEYTCPSHGGWGMVRTGMLIPESHQLFVCPSACGRHGALGAIQQGYKNRLSYLYLEESDIISGYDAAICEAVGELLERLQKRPKVLIVFVSCLDDLIGTDCDAVMEELSQRYPDIQFRMGHMNPISTNSDEPPLVSIWKNVYSLMESSQQEKKLGVNMLGNYVPIHEESEIFEVLANFNMKLYHVGNCTTYEELRDMGNNCLNLLVAAPVEKIAKQLKKTQGIEYVKAHVAYDLEKIKANYQLIFERLKEMGKIADTKESLDGFQEILRKSEEKAVAAIWAAKEKVGNKKLYIDYSAFAEPFAAAKFFYQEGFNIQRVYAKDIDETDENYQWLLKETQVEIIKVNKHDIVNKWKKTDDSISIGMEAAYVSGSRYVVPVFQNEGMYGFYGVCMLMKKLEDCVKEDADLQEVIHQAGLVV